jgi:FkbM family methyltransferase
MEKNLCSKVLSLGGDIIPLVIPNKDTGGTGLMNPSIFVYNDKLIVNIRHINYTLWHSEGEQLFSNKWGPLAYLHPENDIHLKTNNFLCFLNDNLEIEKYYKINMTLDVSNPMWEFHGLEDARLVEWDNKLYMSGVRRDTTPNGEGRIELSEIIIEQDSVKEISRLRTQPPGKPSYCEKNWMPIIDTPYSYVKWCNPTEIVKIDMKTGQGYDIYLSHQLIPNLPDFRGGSQVINWMGLKMAVIHHVNLFKNKLNQKDATYTHRMILWDNNWNIVSMSEPFSFMTGEIEFACGMAIYKGNLLISFGFQDNSSYILKIPEDKIEELFGFKNILFDWGKSLKEDVEVINYEIFLTNIYQKYFDVKDGDIIVDIGANVGAFPYSIKDKNPSRVYCIEPSKNLIKTLKKNLSDMPVTYINKAISDVTLDNKKKDESLRIFVDESEHYNAITFADFIREHDIEKIDFLKIDCEGSEVHIFNKENLSFIKNNVKHIVIEWHLGITGVDKFKEFINLYLRNHNNYKVETSYNVNSHTHENVSEKIFSSNFLEDYLNKVTSPYAQLMVYINNEL